MPDGRLDGIVFSKTGDLFVSSWAGQCVFRIKGRQASFLVKNTGSPADIGYDSKRDRVLIPLMMENAILMVDMKN